MRTLERGRIYESLDSTQKTMRSWVESELPPESGAWISCDQQVAGVGRRGRSWNSLEGNLFLSIAIRFEEWEKIPYFSIMAGLEIRDWVSSLVSVPVTIKWPNDIEISNQKLSGLIGESFRAQGQLWVVLGVGLNLVQTPAVPDRQTTALNAWTKECPSLDEVRLAVAHAVLRAAEKLTIEGFSPERLESVLSFKKGEPITWKTSEGEISKGRYWGLTQGGALRVLLESQEVVTLFNDEVFQVRQNSDSQASGESLP